jgi:hypothetical protein
MPPYTLTNTEPFEIAEFSTTLTVLFVIQVSEIYYYFNLLRYF